MKCPDTIAQPLTTGDQFDTSRALVEAVKYGKECKARQDALVNAVEVREQIMQSIQQQLEGKVK